MTSLILAEYDSPSQGDHVSWTLHATHLYACPLAQCDWHNFCLLSYTGSCSLPCCVQPGCVETCLGMGGARTWYRGRYGPPIAPACIFYGPSVDRTERGDREG